MDALTKSHRLVVVADGARALLLADTGIAPEPKLTVVEAFSEPHASTTAQGTERPGRVHESNGPARSAVEAPDFHTAAEVAFLKRVAGRIEEVTGTADVKRILLVAPPKALGTLRDALGPRAAARLEGALAKDLAGLPVDEIGRHIAT